MIEPWTIKNLYCHVAIFDMHQLSCIIYSILPKSYEERLNYLLKFTSSEETE